MKIYARGFLAAFLFLTVGFSISVFAQNKQSKDELYGKIAKLTQSKKEEDRDKTYLMSKDFLAQFGKEDKDAQVVKIKTFAESYRSNAFNKKLDEVKTAEAYALGKEILAVEPENSYVTMNLAIAGFDAKQKKKDNSFGGDATEYAKKTIALIEAGKLPKTFQPLKDQAEATAYMYYIIGNFQLDADMKQAAQSFYKAVGYDSKIKNDSFPYYVLSAYYEKEYARESADAKAKVDAGTISEVDLKTEQEKLDRIVGNMLDAYARAIKYGEAEKNPELSTWKQRFSDVYKFLKKSDAGMTEYLANQPTTALPDPSAG